jgi:hypothetical protein
LRKEALHKMLDGQEQELPNNIIEISANNEVGLAQRISASEICYPSRPSPYSSNRATRSA